MSILSERLKKAGVFSKNVLGNKDYIKAIKATKYIGYGAVNSSTERYRLAAGDLANCGVYTKEEVIWVSINGRRQGAISVNSLLYMEELTKAMRAGATFVQDQDGVGYGCRMSAHNKQGEAKLAEFFLANGYEEVGGSGVWESTVIPS